MQTSDTGLYFPHLNNISQRNFAFLFVLRCFLECGVERYSSCLDQNFYCWDDPFHLQGSFFYSLGISESSCTILNRNKMKLPFYANPKHQICFNGRHQHDYVLEYLTKYLDAIRSTPQSKPLFAYTSTHISHDDGGIRVQTLDAHLKDFIHKMTAKTNTLSVVFADHGNTYTGYQATGDGKQEMFHPFMLMVVPKTLGKRFGGEILRNLHENQKRLFNLFDLRAGLVELSGSVNIFSQCNYVMMTMVVIGVIDCGNRECNDISCDHGN